MLLRVTGQREAGSLASADLLVVILVAQSVAHAFAPDSTSITDGFILVTTILVLSVLLDSLAYRFTFMRRILKGEVNHHLLRREFLTRQE